MLCPRELRQKKQRMHVEGCLLTTSRPVYWAPGDLKACHTYTEPKKWGQGHAWKRREQRHGSRHAEEG